MPGDPERIFRSLRKLQDVVLTLFAFGAAYWLRTIFGSGAMTGFRDGPEYFVVALLVIIVWSVTLEQVGAYDFSPTTDFATLAVNLLKGVTLSTVLLLSGLYLLKIGEPVSRLLVAEFYVLDLAVLGWSRYLRIRTVRRRHADRDSLRNVLIVGSRQRAQDLITPVIEGRVEGVRFVGCLELDERTRGNEVCRGVRILGTMDDFVRILSTEAVDEVVFAIPLTKIEAPERYIETAERMGVVVRFAPEWGMYKILYSPKVGRLSFEGFAGVPTLTLTSLPADRRGLFLKSVFDRVVAAAGLVLALPLFALIALAIKLSGRGPVFFRQVRSGMNGRRFAMYKLRTMVQNAEELRPSLAGTNEMDGPVFKIARDPRVTALGRFLRRTSLDELPQLLNVLKGEMSLVGPRPPLPEEVEQYELWQRRRLSLRPGLTCLWQVNGRNCVGFQEWMRLDLEYIDNWSWGLDLRILVKTIRVVLLAMGDNSMGQTRAVRDHVEAPTHRPIEALEPTPTQRKDTMRPAPPGRLDPGKRTPVDGAPTGPRAVRLPELSRGGP